MSKHHITGVVRQRGQLTVPEPIRRALDWLKPDAVVDFIVDGINEIRIQPYKEKKTQFATWEELKAEMERIRSFPGKHKGSLSDFVAKDRYRH